MLIIRELKAEDVSTVEQIYSLYWSGDLLDHFCKRLKDYIENTEEILRYEFTYLVAEEDDEVVGSLSFRKAPDFMKKFTTTSNPAEFYVMAVKERGKGIGTVLCKRGIDEVKIKGYTEIVLFSAESHKESWPFHDSFATRVGETNAPNGEPGKVWQLVF